MNGAGDIDLELIGCPNCGAGIEVTQAVGGGAVACDTCGSVLNRRTFGIMGEMASGRFDTGSNIQVGWVCQFRGGRYRVSGRVRYTYDDGHWDEWVMVGSDGTVAYLEECEGEFRWFTPWTPRSAPTRAELEGAQDALHIDGLRYRVKENLHAKLAYFEGQLPWRASVGATVRSLDLLGPAAPAAVEWTRRELEFYKAKPLGRAALSYMFTGHALDLGDVEDDDEDDSTGSSVKTAIIIAFFLVVFLIAISDWLPSSSGSSGTYYGGGHSSGGGFGGGK